LLIHSHGHPLIVIIFFVITSLGVFTFIYLKQTMSEGYIVLLNVMCFYISAFRSMCVVLHMVVYCSSLISCFHSIIIIIIIIIIICVVNL
jgi:hypothetical protein